MVPFDSSIAAQQDIIKTRDDWLRVFMHIIATGTIER
jgi:hypothetical protein